MLFQLLLFVCCGLVFACFSDFPTSSWKLKIFCTSEVSLWLHHIPHNIFPPIRRLFTMTKAIIPEFLKKKAPLGEPCAHRALHDLFTFSCPCSLHPTAAAQYASCGHSWPWTNPLFWPTERQNSQSCTAKQISSPKNALQLYVNQVYNMHISPASYFVISVIKTRIGHRSSMLWVINHLNAMEQ